MKTRMKIVQKLLIVLVVLLTASSLYGALKPSNALADFKPVMDALDEIGVDPHEYISVTEEVGDEWHLVLYPKTIVNEQDMTVYFAVTNAEKKTIKVLGHKRVAPDECTWLTKEELRGLLELKSERK